MSELNKKQASRTRPVPTALADYIDLANVLPAPEQLPAFVNGDVQDHYWDDERQIESLTAKYKAFQDYLGGADLESELPVEAVRRCKFLSTIRAVLRTFARNHEGHLPTENLLRGSRLEDFVSAHADENGKFRVQHHPFLGALEGVELARIRECPICGNIFWAGRIDQPCCETKCAKILRTRRWRENYLGRYKETRIVKAEKEHVAQPPTDEAPEAALKQERNELENKKAPSISRRSARLPVGGRK